MPIVFACAVLSFSGCCCMRDMEEETPSSRRDKTKLATTLKYPPPKPEELARTLSMTTMTTGTPAHDSHYPGPAWNLEGKTRLRPATLQTSSLSMEPPTRSRDSRHAQAETEFGGLVPAVLDLGE